MAETNGGFPSKLGFFFWGNGFHRWGSGVCCFGKWVWLVWWWWCLLFWEMGLIGEVVLLMADLGQGWWVWYRVYRLWVLDLWTLYGWMWRSIWLWQIFYSGVLINCNNYGDFALDDLGLFVVFFFLIINFILFIIIFLCGFVCFIGLLLCFFPNKISGLMGLFIGFMGLIY